MDLEGQIAYMSLSGLHFTYKEFMQMPVGKRLKFLDLAEQYNDSQKVKK